MNTCLALFSNILPLLLTPVSTAFAVETSVFRVDEGRVMQVDVIQPKDSSKPTFLFMPGVNRAVLADADAVKAITEKGYGAVIYNLSTQPFSIAQLGKETPFFESTEPKLRDFAQETEALSKSLAEKYGLKKIIPVSLSYTGAVSPFLKDFPLVIETAPMTSSDAANPTLAQYYQTLKLWELNPFLWSKAQTRAALDTSYRQHWSGQVTAMITHYNLPVAKADQMIEGYVSMSRAAEQLDWKDLNIAGNVRRVFIVAGDEASALKRHQIEVFQSLMKTQKTALLILIQETGHIIPSEQPVAYAAALDLIATNGSASGVVVIKPSTGEIKNLTGAAAEKFLEQEK